MLDSLISEPSPATVPPPPLYTDTTQPEWVRLIGIQQAWFDRIAGGVSPLTEKMTLFWHGLFTTSFSKLYSAQQVWQQHMLFRSQALGNLRELVHQMAVQPAMLNFLDNASNSRTNPQENFARELWELFLLGPGNYTQADVVASARAWTGFSTTEGPDGTTVAKFRPEWHDYGDISIFGATRQFTGPEVIDWTFDGPTAGQVARHIARRLWEFFASTDPSDDLIMSIATTFQTSWEIRPALRLLLSHPEFYTTANVMTMIKSPTEYMATALRSAGILAADCPPNWFSLAMGQDLFNPPDVSGWKGGSSWLSTTTFDAKCRFAKHFAYIAEQRNFLVETRAMSVTDAVGHAFSQFGVTDVSSTTRQAAENWLLAERDIGGWATIRYLILIVLLSPEFQLS
jgi:uncharacterized protein (DUF1800 family)